MSLLSWLGLAPAEGRPGDAEPTESLMRSFQPLEPGRARFLGLFAYLLARMERELVLTNDEYLWVRSQYREKRAVMRMAHPSPP
jgi:hypothetical protein